MKLITEQKLEFGTVEPHYNEDLGTKKITLGVFITTFKSSKQRFETECRKFVARDKHKGVLIRV